MLSHVLGACAARARRSLVIALAIAFVVQHGARAPRAAPTRAGDARRIAGDESEDPDELERAADDAERDGDLDRALRLRFRAGLLRLGDRGAIRYRPSVTTSEVRRALGSRDVRRARAHIRSGRVRRPRRRAARRRHRAARVAARRRRARASGRATDVADTTTRPHAGAVRDRRRDRGRRRSSRSTSLASGIDRAVGGSEPSGVAGSSYGTQATGLAALAALLAHYGHPVAPSARLARRRDPRPGGTVFVIEPQTLTDDDDATLLEFVERGRPARDRRRRSVLPAPTSATGRRRGARRRPAVRPRSTRGSATCATIDDRGRTARGPSPVPAHVLVGSRRHGAAHRATASAGARSSSSPTRRRSRTRTSRSADNAAFALGLAGDAPRPVVFVEGVHGYGESRGLGAIPTPWKIALLVLAAAARRVRVVAQPPVRAARPARTRPPARARRVRARAGGHRSNARTIRAPRSRRCSSGHAIAHRAARRTSGPTRRPKRSTAPRSRSATPKRRRAAIWHPPTDDDTALALGQLVSRLSQHDGRTT